MMSFNTLLLSAGIALICASSSALANENSGDWYQAYTIEIGTQTFSVTHTPEEVCFISGGPALCAGKSLNLGTSGIFVNPFSVSTNMTQDEFEDAIAKAIGVSGIDW